MIYIYITMYEYQSEVYYGFVGPYWDLQGHSFYSKLSEEKGVFSCRAFEELAHHNVVHLW